MIIFSQSTTVFTCKLFTLSTIFLFLYGCSDSTLSAKKPASKEEKGECVIILHGMARTLRSMTSMQTKLSLHGYHTVNLGYPSTKKNIETTVEDHFPQAIQECQQFTPTKIHFVTHSLGGIVLRKALKDKKPANLGRVVMLSPPNKGSAVVDSLENWRFFFWLNGPAGLQLSTKPDSVPNQLGPVDYPVGIITGDRYAFFDAWFSSILPGKDDGKVSVERAKVDGMSDFLIVHESHPFIMNAEYVQNETIYFLEHGFFKHQKNPPPPISRSGWFSFQSK